MKQASLLCTAARLCSDASCDDLEAGTHTDAGTVVVYCFQTATDTVAGGRMPLTIHECLISISRVVGPSGAGAELLD